MTHFTSNLSNHLPLLSPQHPLSFPLLRAERLTFIVNSTPNVRTWHFEYLELNCKHRSTTDASVEAQPRGRCQWSYYLLDRCLRTPSLYICMCVCAGTLFPCLTFVSRDLVSYFVCLPLYLLNLLARPNFRKLSLRYIAVNDTLRKDGFLFCFMIDRMDWSGNLTLLCVRRFSYVVILLEIPEYVESILLQTEERFHVLVHSFYSFRGIYW